MIVDSEAFSLEEKVYKILEEEILTGKLPRGTQLREITLASRLGASRTPIRAALHRLAEVGLVEACANRGAVVVGIDERDVEDIYAIRMRLEGLAARLAASRMSPEAREELSSVLELSEFYAAKHNGGKGSELDSKCHSIIFESSGSRHLSKILTELHRSLKVYRRVSLLDTDRAIKSISEHKEILEAILSGNGELAETLTSRHIENALRSIKTHITE